MEISIITLDEQTAKDFLATNIDNRTPKKSAIERYTDSMLSDRWVVTGESIKLDTQGRLLDGQNRCFALLKANEIAREQDKPPITIQTLLIKGLDPSTQDYMDSGIVRSLKDQLTMRGMYNYSVAGTAARIILAWQSGRLIGTNARYRAMDKIVYIDWLLKHPEIEESMRFVATHDTCKLHKPALAAAHWILLDATNDQEAVDEFIESLRMGTNLQKGNPILALRTRSLRMHEEGKTFHNSHQVIAILKCWNWWRTNTEIATFPIYRKSGGTITAPEKIEP